MMSRMANMRFADHNFSSSGEYQSVSPSVRDAAKSLCLEDVRKIFSCPTIITDEGLRQILPDTTDQFFEDVIGRNGERYFFKRSHHGDRFREFVSKQSLDKSEEKTNEQILPIFNDGYFQNLLKFKLLSKSKGSSIIAIISINLRTVRSFEPVVLRDLFGLTLAEARVAICLHNGLSVNDAAEQAGVRISTVRDQLSSIFSKTRTSRQSELVSILSRLELVVG